MHKNWLAFEPLAMYPIHDRQDSHAFEDAHIRLTAVFQRKQQVVAIRIQTIRSNDCIRLRRDGRQQRNDGFDAEFG
jgi:hypothetical protein